MPAPRDQRFRIRVRIGDGDGARALEIDGRDGWALHNLIEAAERGCTPIDTPSPRWSGYVHKLRKRYGISVETVSETHSGTFPGHHARYVLRSPVELVDHDDGDIGIPFPQDTANTAITKTASLLLGGTRNV